MHHSTKVFLLLALLLASSTQASVQQNSTIQIEPNSQAHCDYQSSDMNQPSATFTQHGGYWQETYSTQAKNPYPYYGSACSNQNSNVINPNVIFWQKSPNHWPNTIGANQNRNPTNCKINRNSCY